MRTSKTETRLLCAALLAGALLILAGCGSSEDNGGTTTTTGGSVTTESGTQAQAASLNSARDSGLKPSVGNLYEFVSPSKNIGCVLDPQGARCDIREYTWKNPPKPASCEFDWGGTLHVSGKHAGEIGCISDSAAGGKDTLAYGTYVQNKRLRCTSQTSGMTCKNLRTGHGFFVSRERYRVF
jgi:hypothetical protein